MRIRNLDIGVESITRRSLDDEVHLPAEGGLAPSFLPRQRPLDAILRRPSLDERLPDLLQPSHLDPGLLEPAVLSETRLDLHALLLQQARRSVGAARGVLEEAARQLDRDADLDDEVRSALALLLKG